jgi:hypothetical protein
MMRMTVVIADLRTRRNHLPKVRLGWGNIVKNELGCFTNLPTGVSRHDRLFPIVSNRELTRSIDPGRTEHELYFAYRLPYRSLLRQSNAELDDEQELASDEEVKEVKKFVPVAGFTSDTIRDGDEVLEYFERKGYIKRVSAGRCGSRKVAADESLMVFRISELGMATHESVDGGRPKPRSPAMKASVNWRWVT